jgi:tetratricopeptide (TPR) repeat protein
MEFLYSKAAEYAPYLSLMRFIKGQFYLSCNNANDAAKCFREAYDIDKDPTIKKWPHLQVTESNAKLISILGFSLQEAGDVEEGQKFLQAGQAMAGKIREKIASLDAPNLG